MKKLIYIVAFAFSCTLAAKAQTTTAPRTDGYYYFVNTDKGYTRMLFFGSNGQSIDSIVYGATPVFDKMPGTSVYRVYTVSLDKQGVMVNLKITGLGPYDVCENCDITYRVSLVSDGMRITEVSTEKKKWKKMNEVYQFILY